MSTVDIYEVTGSEGDGPHGIVTGAVESGAGGVLADQGTLPERFFDLSTRFAGELLHELAKYGIPMAVVMPDASVHSERFREFGAEANRRREIRFFSGRDAAEVWLRREMA